VCSGRGNQVAPSPGAKNLAISTAHIGSARTNNQWKLDDEIGGSLEESSFRKAMKLSFGTVTVLDEGGFTFFRIWCGYEIFTRLANSSLTEVPLNSSPRV
jgi:hypothetical protein